MFITTLQFKEKLFAYLAFQITWFSCLLSTTEVYLSVSLVTFAYYLYLLRKIHFPLFLPLGLAFLGYCLDLLWQSLSWIRFTGEETFSSSLFLLLIWIAFILSIPLIMQPVLKKKVWAILLSFSVPFSYLAGQKLNAVQYYDPEWRAMSAQIMSYLLILFLYQMVWLFYMRRYDNQKGSYPAPKNSVIGKSHE